jgi:hypothetical protein
MGLDGSGGITGNPMHRWDLSGRRVDAVPRRRLGQRCQAATCQRQRDAAMGVSVAGVAGVHGLFFIIR